MLYDSVTCVDEGCNVVGKRPRVVVVRISRHVEGARAIHVCLFDSNRSRVFKVGSTHGLKIPEIIFWQLNFCVVPRVNGARLCWGNR